MRYSLGLVALAAILLFRPAHAGDLEFKSTGFDCDKGWQDGLTACNVHIAVSAHGYPGSFSVEAICNAEVETTPSAFRGGTQSGTAVAYLRGNRSARANVVVVVAWGRTLDPIRRAELKSVNCYLP